MNLALIYAGKVEANADPLKLGRLKIRVPHVYGSNATGSGYIPTNDLPWALPAGMPAGGSSASGGLSHLPAVGDSVWVRFLDAEAEKPVWEWGMQTQAQAKTFKLHQYAEQEKNGQQITGAPNRSILTRYGHSVELTANQIVVTTAEGYQLALEGLGSNSGGSVNLRTPKGQCLRMNDLGESVVSQALDANVVSGKSVILNGATSIFGKTTRFTIMVGSTLLSIQNEVITLTTGSGATLVIDASGNIALTAPDGSSLAIESGKVQLGTADGTGLVIENGQLSVNAPKAVINTSAFAVGTAAAYPVAMMTPQMLAWLVGHTHLNGNNGSPTGPPIPIDPAFPADSTSKTMQTI